MKVFTMKIRINRLFQHNAVRPSLGISLAEAAMAAARERTAAIGAFSVWRNRLRVAHGSFDQQLGGTQVLQKLPHIRAGRPRIDLVLVQNSLDQGILCLLLPECFKQDSADLIQADDPGEDLPGVTGGNRDHLI